MESVTCLSSCSVVLRHLVSGAGAIHGEFPLRRFPKRNHAAIRSLTFSARNVRRVTVSVMKSVVYCPM